MMTHTRLAWFATLLTLPAATACRDAGAKSVDTLAARTDSLRRDSIARARQDSINRTQPGYVIDSILPIEENVRRFKATIGGSPVRSLHHASASREALVRRIVHDVATRDTVDLAAAAITPREFIDLVYPSSPYTHPPYRESPQVVWMQIANPSNSGYLRLVRRLAGQPFEYDSYTCAAKPDRQGANTLWVGCTLRVLDPNHELTTQHWFGTIIEREGRFKVLSFHNQF